MKRLALTLAALTALFFTGCSTPASRIHQNPAAFDRATREQQELIKQGKVALGFDEELVQLALGVPDRRREIINESGTKVVWSYVNYEASDGMILYRGWYHRGWWGPSYAYYADYPNRREREHFRVVFKDHKVVSIEQETT